jgi:vacuolar-type H+-ATPase subunit E/Vma4
MLIGISTKEEVMQFFINYAEKQIQVIDEDDELYFSLIVAAADDIVSNDVDFWANQSVKELLYQAKEKLLGNQ